MFSTNTIIKALDARQLLQDDVERNLFLNVLQVTAREEFSLEMPWGKHQGKTLKAIFEEDPRYLRWLYKTEYVKDDFSDIYEEVKQRLGH